MVVTKVKGDRGPLTEPAIAAVTTERDRRHADVLSLRNLTCRKTIFRRIVSERIRVNRELVPVEIDAKRRDGSGRKHRGEVDHGAVLDAPMGIGGGQFGMAFLLIELQIVT